MSEDNDSASGRQVISRAAAVLRALAEDNSGQSLGQIAKKTDLPRTTVHRIVAALEAQQLAATTPAGVRLGQALVRLAASAHTDVVAAARPFVEALGRRLRETVDLCVFRGQHAVSVDQFASDQELRVVAAVGTAYPIHCTAHGKALLARLDDAALEELLGARLERRTASTITARKDLLAQLAEVGPGAGHWTWRNTRSASAGSACISRPANPSSTRCRSRCRPRATKGSSTPAWRPCSSARPRLNPCWPADRAAALGRRRRDGRSCGEGLKCNEIFNFSLHQAVIQAQPRRRSGARAVHPCFPPQDFSVPGP